MAQVVRFSILFVFLSIVARAESPVLTGLGLAGRGGVPGEGIYGNPAVTYYAQKSTSYLFYTKPSVKDFHSGGRGYSVGAVDADNPEFKGAAGYDRFSRARVGNAGEQVYEDRQEFRIGMARAVSSSVVAGVNAQYVIRKQDGIDKKFFQGTAGLAMPIFTDMNLGATYEQFSNEAGERPPTGGLGVNYSLAQTMRLYGDAAQILQGPKKGTRTYAFGAELTVGGEFVVRGGTFKDGYRARNGWSMGASWSGPRASFDYAMRTTTGIHKEKDHVFGMTVQL